MSYVVYEYARICIFVWTQNVTTNFFYLSRYSVIIVEHCLMEMDGLNYVVKITFWQSWTPCRFKDLEMTRGMNE